MYDETSILPFDPKRSLAEFGEFSHNTTKQSKRFWLFNFAERNGDTIRPLPSISRGNMVSPINGTSYGVAKTIVRRHDLLSAKSEEEARVKRKAYNEYETRKLINEIYGRSYIKEKCDLLKNSHNSQNINYKDYQYVEFEINENNKTIEKADQHCNVSKSIKEASEKPRIKYAFAEKSAPYELLEYELKKYRASKTKVQSLEDIPKTEKFLLGIQNSEIRPVPQLDLDEILREKDVFCRTSPRDDESEEHVLRDKNTLLTMEEKQIRREQKEYRVRRKIAFGSYDNDSVDEDKLPNLLRYVWKGKLAKLSNILKYDKTHQRINIQDSKGRTALHYAASWDCKQTMGLLLRSSSINVNICDWEGKTPLHKAVEIFSTDCVRMLVEYGCNALVKCRNGFTAFEYALKYLGDRYFSLIKTLIYAKGVLTEYTQPYKLSALHHCCISSRKISVVEVAKELIKAGVDVNHEETSGRTPIMIAAQMDNAQIVKLLIENNADVRHVDMTYKSVIHFAQPNSRCHQLICEQLERLNPLDQWNEVEENENVSNNDDFTMGMQRLSLNDSSPNQRCVDNLDEFTNILNGKKSKQTKPRKDFEEIMSNAKMEGNLKSSISEKKRLTLNNISPGCKRHRPSTPTPTRT